MKRINKTIFLVLIISFFVTIKVHAAQTNIQIPNVSLSVNGASTPKDYVDNIQLLLLLTMLTFIPAILLLMTSFTRIIIVLGFVRNALSTQQTPPNQVLIAIALFMTFFIMAPVYTKVNDVAIQPYLKGTLTQEEAYKAGSRPMKDFMLKQTYQSDIALFYKAAKVNMPKEKYEIPFRILVPAFATSELKTAFEMGFMIFIPFVIIDMVVASILMSMGMFMLSPVTISLPFKILLFVMADGWHLVIKSLIQSFY